MPEQFPSIRRNSKKDLGCCVELAPVQSNFQGRRHLSRDTSFDALALMPLLSKQMLRAEASDLVTEKPIPKGTIIFKSSGTTGTPTEIYYTPEFHALELAVPEVRTSVGRCQQSASAALCSAYVKSVRLARANRLFGVSAPPKIAYCVLLSSLAPIFGYITLSFFDPIARELLWDIRAH